MREWVLRLGVLGLALVACSSSGADSPDATVPTIDGQPDAHLDLPDLCDPVLNTGCNPGQKCSYSIHFAQPTVLALTECVPDGEKRLGESCTSPDTDMGEIGTDDCVGGTWCHGGVCTNLCLDVGSNACDSGVCVVYSNLFEDRNAVGVCSDACDPIAQNCQRDGHGCYLVEHWHESACLPVASQIGDVTEGRQDDDCYASEPYGCHENGCAEGFGPVLNRGLLDNGSSPVVCAAFCTPTPTSVHDPAGFAGDASVVGWAPGNCGVERAGQAPGPYDCRFIQSFYSNTASVPATIGMCVPTAEWGRCDQNDPANPTAAGCEPLNASNRSPLQRPAFNGDVSTLTKLANEAHRRD